MGHIISREGITIDPSKIRDIMDWLAPTTMTEVCIFRGLAGYYMIFIQDFFQIAHPITSLQRKGKKFIWSDRCKQDFSTLKGCLTTKPILIVSNPQGELFVCTDASLAGIGGVLM